MQFRAATPHDEATIRRGGTCKHPKVNLLRRNEFLYSL